MLTDEAETKVRARRSFFVRHSAHRAVQKGEDAWVQKPFVTIQVNKDSETGFGLFGVFDGHGGKAAATFVSNRILPTLTDCVKKYLPANLDEPVFHPPRACGLDTETLLHYHRLDHVLKALPCALTDCFRLLQDDFVHHSQESGTTATIVANVDWEVVIANVGDSWAYLDTGAQVLRVSGDHRLESNVNEQKRIMTHKGYELSSSCVEGRPCGPLRVWPGGLAMARSLGDFEAGIAVTCEPEVRQITLPPSGGRIVIASDGLWDAVNPKTALHHIRRYPSTKAAGELVQFALKRDGLQDDISVLVIDFVPHEDDKIPPMLNCNPSHSPIPSADPIYPLEANSSTWLQTQWNRRLEHFKEVKAAEAAAIALKEEAARLERERQASAEAGGSDDGDDVASDDQADMGNNPFRTLTEEDEAADWVTIPVTQTTKKSKQKRESKEESEGGNNEKQPKSGNTVASKDTAASKNPKNNKGGGKASDKSKNDVTGGESIKSTKNKGKNANNPEESKDKPGSKNRSNSNPKGFKEDRQPVDKKAKKVPKSEEDTTNKAVKGKAQGSQNPKDTDVVKKVKEPKKKGSKSAANNPTLAGVDEDRFTDLYNQKYSQLHSRWAHLNINSPNRPEERINYAQDCDPYNPDADAQTGTNPRGYQNRFPNSNEAHMHRSASLNVPRRAHTGMHPPFIHPDHAPRSHSLPVGTPPPPAQPPSSSTGLPPPPLLTRHSRPLFAQCPTSSKTSKSKRPYVEHHLPNPPEESIFSKPYAYNAMPPILPKHRYTFDNVPGSLTHRVGSAPILRNNSATSSGHDHEAKGGSYSTENVVYKLKNAKKVVEKRRSGTAPPLKNHHTSNKSNLDDGGGDDGALIFGDIHRFLPQQQQTQLKQPQLPQNQQQLHPQQHQQPQQSQQQLYQPQLQPHQHQQSHTQQPQPQQYQQPQLQQHQQSQPQHYQQPQLQQHPQSQAPQQHQPRQLQQHQRPQQHQQPQPQHQKVLRPQSQKYQQPQPQQHQQPKPQQQPQQQQYQQPKQQHQQLQPNQPQHQQPQPKQQQHQQPQPKQQQHQQPKLQQHQQAKPQQYQQTKPQQHQQPKPHQHQQTKPQQSKPQQHQQPKPQQYQQSKPQQQPTQLQQQPSPLSNQQYVSHSPPQVLSQPPTYAPMQQQPSSHSQSHPSSSSHQHQPQHQHQNLHQQHPNANPSIFSKPNSIPSHIPNPGIQLNPDPPHHQQQQQPPYPHSQVYTQPQSQSQQQQKTKEPAPFANFDNRDITPVYSVSHVPFDPHEHKYVANSHMFAQSNTNESDRNFDAPTGRHGMDRPSSGYRRSDEGGKYDYDLQQRVYTGRSRVHDLTESSRSRQMNAHPLDDKSGRRGLSNINKDFHQDRARRG